MWTRRGIGALLGMAVGAALLGAGGSEARFPAQVTDVDGRRIDITLLAAQQRLIVVTLKATWCPVCARQLVRLERLRPGLENCGATFLVLSPGPAERIRALRKATGFSARYVEDRDLAIARSLGLRLTRDQILPGLFAIDASLQIAWEQRGRNGAHYGDGKLQEYLGCKLIAT